MLQIPAFWTGVACHSPANLSIFCLSLLYTNKVKMSKKKPKTFTGLLFRANLNYYFPVIARAITIALLYTNRHPEDLTYRHYIYHWLANLKINLMYLLI